MNTKGLAWNVSSELRKNAVPKKDFIQRSEMGIGIEGL